MSTLIALIAKKDNIFEQHTLTKWKLTFPYCHKTSYCKKTSKISKKIKAQRAFYFVSLLDVASNWASNLLTLFSLNFLAFSFLSIASCLLEYTNKIINKKINPTIERTTPVAKNVENGYELHQDFTHFIIHFFLYRISLRN